MHILLPGQMRAHLAGAALAIFACMPAPLAHALDITPDPNTFAATQVLPVTQSQVNWNLSRLNPKTSGGEGVVAWALLGPTDLPTSSKVRTAWLEREITRMHDKLGNKDRISVSMPRHFEPVSIGGSNGFSGQFEVTFPDHSFLSPVYIVPLAQGRGRFVVLALMSKDDVAAKAASAFAETWAARLLAEK